MNVVPVTTTAVPTDFSSVIDQMATPPTSAVPVPTVSEEDMSAGAISASALVVEHPKSTTGTTAVPLGSAVSPKAVPLVDGQPAWVVDDGDANPSELRIFGPDDELDLRSIDRLDVTIPETNFPKNNYGALGTNIFVFHIPSEWNDRDLEVYFEPFGALTSVRIRKEQDTQRTLGFGFVAYRHPLSAAKAVAALNGLRVTNKRLKVGPKKGEEVFLQAVIDQERKAQWGANNPYCLTNATELAANLAATYATPHGTVDLATDKPSKNNNGKRSHMGKDGLHNNNSLPQPHIAPIPMVDPNMMMYTPPQQQYYNPQVMYVQPQMTVPYYVPSMVTYPMQAPQQALAQQPIQHVQHMQQHPMHMKPQHHHAYIQNASSSETNEVMGYNPSPMDQQQKQQQQQQQQQQQMSAHHAQAQNPNLMYAPQPMPMHAHSQPQQQPNVSVNSGAWNYPATAMPSAQNEQMLVRGFPSAPMQQPQQQPMVYASYAPNVNDPSQQQQIQQQSKPTATANSNQPGVYGYHPLQVQPTSAHAQHAVPPPYQMMMGTNKQHPHMPANPNMYNGNF